MKTYVDAAGLQEYTTKLVARLRQLFPGTPLSASTVAGMTDTSRIYVYTGSETGYTAGNWYYWDGSAWTSGGAYNAVAINTDTTLSVSGMAADAAATGDAIGAVDDIADVNAQILALAEDVAIPFKIDGTGYIKSDGTIASATTLAPTDYIPVDRFFALKFKRYGTTTSSTSVMAVAIYDATKTKISTVAGLTSQAATGYGATPEIVYLPEGAAYARFSTYIDTVTYGAFEVYGHSTALGTALGDADEKTANAGGVGAIEVTHGAYVANDTTVDLSSITPTPTTIQGDAYAVADCAEGEVFTITGQGSVSALLWAFFDENGNNLTHAKTNECRILEQITAPVGAVKLIANGIGLIVWRGIPVNEGITGGPYPPNAEAVAVSIVAKKRFTNTTIGNVLTVDDNNGYAYFVTAASTGERYRIQTYNANATDGRYYVYATDANDVVVTRTSSPQVEGNLPGGSYTFDFTVPAGATKLWVMAAANANNASSRLKLWKLYSRPIRQVFENALTPYASDGMTAPDNITAGEFFLAEGQLYKATANISSGGTITPGTNATRTTIAEQLTALWAAVNS